MTQELWVMLAGQAFAAVGVYAAIRADLREALVRIAAIEKRQDRLEGCRQ